MNDQDEGWINEVGAYISKDVSRVILFPFLMILKGIRGFGNWVSVPKNAAHFIEHVSGLVLFIWFYLAVLSPNAHDNPLAGRAAIVLSAIVVTYLITIILLTIMGEFS